MQVTDRQKANLKRWIINQIAKSKQPISLSHLDYVESGEEPWETLDTDFPDAMFDLERQGHIVVDDVHSGTENETCFIDMRGSEDPATKRLLFDEEAMPKLTGPELRFARDRVIAYIYENGASNYGYSMPIDDILANTGLNNFQIRDVVGLLINQGLMSKSTMDSIGLNQQGQAEAERLGPTIAMRAPLSPNYQIDARYSIVQIAGANSTQNATQSFDSGALTELLGEIERTLPTLEMQPAARTEAQGLIEALKGSAIKGAADAVTRAVGGALSAILSAAGSPLGKSLLVLLGISI
ncbi:hypothetical protein J2046_006284 [Rhizobium petrolearium]|uniref:hypothetical protein n=1 Tax=Neorhizobium petrolearium TaxID=515361 RepID=UPI001AE336D3|nr:hypothetical protein [Neorhizobium petrolearium]MBP1847999.1 hypothetical protein [Neorhizobium petrolearium]